MNIEDIKIESIENLIHAKLINKFTQNNITNLGELKELSVEDFSAMRSVGVKAISLFKELKNDLNTSPEKFILEYEKGLPKILPFSINVDLSNQDQNFLFLFNHMIEDYFTIKKNFHYKTPKSKKLNQKYSDIAGKIFGLNSKKYTRAKIATRYRFETERVRQILVKFQNEIKKILNGEFISEWNCSANSEAISIINSFQKELSGFSVINTENLRNLLKEYGVNPVNDQLRNYLDCLMRIWGFNEFESNRHHLLRNNKFYFSDTIDKDLFFDVANSIVKYLQSEVLPVSFDDIAIEVLDEFEVEDEFIKKACDNILEVEKLSESKYQISFDFLSSINDYAFRVLSEKNKKLSYNELLNLINTRLIENGKQITSDQLKTNLRKDDKIMPIGKMGIWSLREWSPNIDSQKDLIIKAMRSLGKPLTIKEITDHINQVFDRKNVSEKSISSNLRNYKNHFLKIKGNQFILAELKNIYINDLVKTRNPKKKTGILKSEIIKRKAIEVLKSIDENETSLIKLVKTLQKVNSTFSDKAIYRVINENPLDFKKSTDNNGKKVVSLVSVARSNPIFSLKRKYKWNELKPILKRELKLIFDSHIQPTYPNTLDEALDNFFKLITINTFDPELNALHERVLPTLYKFYIGASDRNDKLNYLKQLATSQEAFLKKLLSFINPITYNEIKRHKKGFGTVISNLPKIDPRENRHKDLRTANQFEFGKHCSRAYSKRNIESHNAADWTESEIIESKVSCLVFLVYSTFEYYDEIERI